MIKKISLRLPQAVQYMYIHMSSLVYSAPSHKCLSSVDFFHLTNAFGIVLEMYKITLFIFLGYL